MEELQTKPVQRDIGELEQEIHTCLDSGNIEQLGNIRNEVMALGHNALLEWCSSAYHGLKQGVDARKVDVSPNLSDEDYFLCLKNAITQERGKIYDFSSVVANLYRKFFPDEKADLILFGNESRKSLLVSSDMKHLANIYHVVLSNAQTPAEAKTHLDNIRKRITIDLINSYAKQNDIERDLVELAKATGMDGFLDQVYERRLGELGRTNLDAAIALNKKYKEAISEPVESQKQEFLIDVQSQDVKCDANYIPAKR